MYPFYSLKYVCKISSLAWERERKRDRDRVREKRDTLDKPWRDYFKIHFNL